MTPGTLVLLHSPLTTASAWDSLAGALGAHHVVVPEVTDDDRAPYAGRYVARAALEITAAGVRPPVVLVGHGGAGPLLPALGGAQRAAHRLVGGYVFLDADLPGPPRASRRDLIRSEDAGITPDWEQPPASVTLRPRGDEFFTEELPMAQDWPDAPCGYLRTSVTYAGQAGQAEMRGWTVFEHLVGHFAAVEDPDGTAVALAALIAAL